MCDACNIRPSKVRDLNDRFRTSLSGGRIFMTASVQALGTNIVVLVLQKVRAFNQFDSDNDPYSEHDFGAIEIGQRRFFWKIDYYDRLLEAGSPDPADSTATVRVLTIMLADEY